MQPYQRDFVKFCGEVGVLRFGDFTLKSGRQSPYFFNTGRFDTGSRLARLAGAYARRIIESGLGVDMLYGPAYKGIPLAAATSMTLALEHGRDLPFAFNRKEAKDHGEGGVIVGRPLAGRVLIIDDVITAGTSVAESVAIIRAAGAEVAAVIIALDRQERGSQGRSAVAEVGERYGCPVLSVVTLDDLIQVLEESADAGDLVTRLRAYRDRYGV